MLLREKSCSPLKDIPPLDEQQASSLLSQLDQQWQLSEDHKSISFDFQFNNFHETMSFVNALAWIAHQQDHHPELEVSYKHCLVHYSTHSVDGLSENDFICAAKIERLVLQT